MSPNEEKLHRYLTDNQPLENLSAAADIMGVSCWLVGGALRDVLLDRPVTDVDLATAVDPTPLAKSWAREQGGHWFWLDEERCQSRVLLRYGRLEFCLDFAPLRAATLEQDLRLRDYTINAMALPLQSPLTEQQLIDPLGGIDDLQNRQLRHCSERSLADDPLRILKGIRHAVTLDMRISQETERLMCAAAENLAESAAERKRNELGRILSSKRVPEGLKLLERCGLFPILFDQPAESFSLDQLLPVLNRFDGVMDQWAADEILAGLLDETYEETMTRRTLYLLGLLLREYRGRHLDAVVREQLRLSRRSVATLENLLTSTNDCLTAYATLPDNNRARVLWLEGLGRTAVDQLIFFAALNDSAPLNLAAVKQLLADYFDVVSSGRIPDLLSGREIQRLHPGIDDKRIGMLQKKLKQAEITGKIASEKEARELLRTEISIDNP